MATTGKQRGQPARPAPKPINTTPEEPAEAFPNGPPDHQWEYLKGDKKGAAK